MGCGCLPRIGMAQAFAPGFGLAQMPAPHLCTARCAPQHFFGGFFMSLFASPLVGAYLLVLYAVLGW